MYNRNEFTPNQERIASKFLLFCLCFVICAALYRLCVGDTELKSIKENPIFIIGEVTKVKIGKGPIEADYKYNYKKKSYSGWQILNNKEYYLIEKTSFGNLRIPFETLIVLNEKNPSESRIVIDRDIIKEFHIPDSIIKELNALKYSYIIHMK